MLDAPAANGTFGTRTAVGRAGVFDDGPDLPHPPCWRPLSQDYIARAKGQRHHAGPLPNALPVSLSLANVLTGGADFLWRAGATFQAHDPAAIMGDTLVVAVVYVIVNLVVGGSTIRV